ncbi:GntR family transcriptional regulator [Mycetocola tolaasinivorans]|uniref:GntR family transcriptional regulator n=1 Tax=Mycetocola tolaasinivorans TaxID=76635 RepID=A0A3L7A5X9_9MICO|nr:GntR family transcriptional regulator [Mycetocola tolaasinivorans]RLP75719.1 GntR family transcriptional regulator [Mycetocola tolaasinivorans]
MNTQAAGPTPKRQPLKRIEIAQQLREAIVEGTYGNGELLPGENELAERFDVSRGTIRRALESLAEEHLVDTRTGIGSFVTFDGHALDQGASWGNALALGGIQTSVRILRAERIVDPELAASVSPTGMEFLALDRLRLLPDGTPVSLERSRVPFVGALARVPEHGLVGDSLTTTMGEAGLIPASGEQWVSATPLSAEDAALLERAHGELFLNSIRITRDADGTFIEKVVSWLDPAHFRLHTYFGA